MRLDCQPQEDKNEQVKTNYKQKGRSPNISFDRQPALPQLRAIPQWDWYEGSHATLGVIRIIS
ncbi:hypothetical protein Q0590_36675 [Rhodocytophaga aerolata]|uniref:Uncharacterized protein n=1 Tax=Rhodocytophaga aerolata TaxID=455078 RepID=A0ABT8RIC4_9BACT|nr:hypothetical protein [Rhodocytophaga aerolata]MDO1451862.1 hypothetical protein [Rhodocytophaga aerolata]